MLDCVPLADFSLITETKIVTVHELFQSSYCLIENARLTEWFVKLSDSVKTKLTFDVNLNLIVQKVLTMGFSYRKEESVDFMFKAQITPQLQLGYAYDHPIGRIARLSNGSHEAMVQYVFSYAHKNLSSPR